MIKNIKYLDNCSIKESKLSFLKSIDTYKNIIYLNRVDNNIYFKYINKIGIKPDNETVSIINISDPKNPIFVTDFDLNKSIACHNLYFFKNKDNKINAIGGQHLGKANFDEFKNNKKYDEYHKHIEYINSKKYGIKMSGYEYIYDNNKICPYYANGLHLFELDDKDLKCCNNNLPIISGIHEGRHDGHYGNCDNKNLSSSEGGLTVYDSLGSIVFNSEEKIYYLYHRANIGTGRRYIQYSTSSDLINWSAFNIINLLVDDIFNYNIYYSNFFKYKNIYLAILPITKRNIHSSHYDSSDGILNLNLYYSFDCKIYNLIGSTITKELIHNNIETFYLCTNEPMLYENTLYFYLQNNNTNKLEIYTLDIDRFYYISNNTNEEANFVFEKDYIYNINMNIDVEQTGYIKIELIDTYNNIIDGYSYKDFDIITNIDSFNFIPTWNNSYKLPSIPFKICFKFLKAKIFDIY